MPEADNTLVEARRVADKAHMEASQALQQRNKFLMVVLAFLLSVASFLAGTNFNGWMMADQMNVLEKRLSRAEYVIETMTGNYNEVKMSINKLDIKIDEIMQAVR